MYPVIFIVGPTAIGKTGLAYSLAKKIGAEIISCDSMLVYKEPRIITAKPSPKILSEVRHHFVNIISVSQPYSVYQYYRDAVKLIKNFYKQNKPVIVCGGTGLYFKALLDGIFEQRQKDESLRAKLSKQAEQHGLSRLYKKLQKIDLKTASQISENDKKRIVRALEVYELTGEPISKKQKEAKGLWPKIKPKIFGLTLNRGKLYARINRRVDGMFDKGAAEEVKRLLSKKLSLTAEKIIGINEIRGYLEGRQVEVEAKDKMKQNTRNFAKRQITWFKKDSRIKWIDVDNRTAEEIANEIENRVLSQ